MFVIKRSNFLKRDVLIWSVILFAAFFLRLYGLDLNPVGITHDDELHEIINAKSLALTGSNVPGVVTGILTRNGHCIWGDCVYGELESYTLVPWMLIFPLGLVLSKIPFVLGAVGLVFATGKLFENLSKNATIGLIVGLLVAINPWAVYFGRTAYPQLVSHLFYILGLYFFTRHKSYRSNLALGGLSSFVAFLFYFGAKPILPLIILWGVAYNLYQFKIRHLKFTLLFGFVVTIIIGGYFLALSHSYAGIRLSEIEIGKSSNISGLINRQSPRVERFLGFFSPISLFLKGQTGTDNSYISNYGYYYPVDLPFLVFGIMAISINLTNALFILMLIVIAVIPAALKTSETSIYSLRAALAYPLISGVIGWGYYFCWGKISILKQKYVAKIFLALVIIVYVLSLIYFLVIYWHYLLKDQATRWFFHERVLTNYITRTQKSSNKKIIVVTARPDGTFNSFIFYSGIYNDKNTVNQINNSYLLKSFEYGGVRFIDDCQKITRDDLANNVILIDQINPVECNIDQKNTPKIANPHDAGGIYNIINESLCSNYSKNRYPNPGSIYDFKVENLTNKTFCKIWITNPDQSPNI